VEKIFKLSNKNISLLTDMGADKSIGQLIEESFQQVEKGATYSEIRTELKEMGIKPDTVSVIIKEVDERVIAADLKKAKLAKVKEQRIWGYILMTVGAVLTILAYAGMIHIKPQFFYVVAFGPVIGGYILVKKANASMKK